ncbi:GNAT family N-acetyltransferase [Egibacter rhizosphaerae]|uniref:GNAT family N-acetyltransferase n=1 Tax=Egibacter rhizosphaerae TaxID=1670831 RepID=A0A411YCU0_9ACTN|nr:GNAT family N-acetyltransferase [Egibacter rhizosphaerae]QBI19051.1 GNAT family N-acetyltransferase [Egibacter rhizosphaerae]
MRIRPVAPNEHDAVGELTVAAYATLGEPLGDYAGVLRDVAARAEACEVIVAEEGGTLLGTVTYIPGPGHFAEWDDPRAAGIRFLAVDPAIRRRGVAEALVRWSLARARDEGWARFVLHTTDWMHAAHRLYEKLGFERAPELDWEPERTVKLLGYRTDLDSRISS